MNNPIANMPPLVTIEVHANGQTRIMCNIAKIEAVKLLGSVMEELRYQAYRESERLVQVAPGMPDASVLTASS